MNHRHMTATALALVAAAVPATALAATQPPPAKTATPLGKVHSAGATATLRVRYSCKTGDTLWISLKQSKSGKKDPALKKEGSSKAAHSWLQSHRNKVVCDGKKHSKKFSVDKLEQGKGKLKKGKAWLQFCVTDAKTQLLTVSVARWVTVK
jgi:hypothetical protein